MLKKKLRITKRYSYFETKSYKTKSGFTKRTYFKKENLSFLRPAPIDPIAPYEFENVLSKELKNEKKWDYLKHEDLK